MATVIWRGDAPAVAQESRATPANVEVGDIFTLTINTKSISFTATATTVANVTAGLTAAWNASAVAEHAEVTASDETTYVKLLGDTAGKPFTCTGTATEGGSCDTQTLSVTTPTAATGPNCWDTAANWSGGAVPVNGDDVIIEDTSVSILYGLGQSAVTLDSLTAKKNFTGTIGLPRITSTGYYEYRETYLEIGASVEEISQGQGSGSGRIKLDNGSVQTALTIFDTGTSSDSSLGAVIWKGTNASNSVKILSGTLSIAPYGGESATISTLSIYGGTTDSRATVTTLTQRGGTLTTMGIVTITTFVLQEGTCYYEGGPVVTFHGSGGILDFRNSSASRSFTNTTLHEGAEVHDPDKTVTWTNGIDLYRCDPTEVTLDIGAHQTLSMSAI